MDSDVEEEDLLYTSFFKPAQFKRPLEAFEHDTRVTNGVFCFVDLIKNVCVF